jgi:hypothetical protein
MFSQGSLPHAGEVARQAIFWRAGPILKPGRAIPAPEAPLPKSRRQPAGPWNAISLTPRPQAPEQGLAAADGRARFKTGWLPARPARGYGAPPAWGGRRKGPALQDENGPKDSS